MNIRGRGGRVGQSSARFAFRVKENPPDFRAKGRDAGQERSRRPLNSLDIGVPEHFAHVDRVHLVTGVLPAHVCAHVRHVLGAVMAIGTIESGRLAALEFRVIVKIILVTEDARTGGTGELGPAGGEIVVGGGEMVRPRFPSHVARHRREREAHRRDVEV